MSKPVSAAKITRISHAKTTIELGGVETTIVLGSTGIYISQGGRAVSMMLSEADTLCEAIKMVVDAASRFKLEEEV